MTGTISTGSRPGAADGWKILSALLGSAPGGTPAEGTPGLPPVGSVGLTWRELADAIGFRGASADTFGPVYVRVRNGLHWARRHAETLGMGLTIPRPVTSDGDRYRLTIRGKGRPGSLGAGIGWTVTLDDATTRVRTVVRQHETILGRTDLPVAEKIEITRSVTKVEGMLLVLEDEVARLRILYPPRDTGGFRPQGWVILGPGAAFPVQPPTMVSVTTDRPRRVRPTFIVIPCGSEKATEATAARDLYTGSMFRLALAAATAEAEAVNGTVLILSALHGLITLDEEVAPYDLRMGEAGSVEAKTLTTQAEGHGITWGSDVYAFLPRAYFTKLDEGLRDLDVYAADVYEADAGIGFQRHTCAVVRDA